MIVEVLQTFEGPGWRVSLCRSNYRPERCFVEIERAAMEDEVESWCVGFADDLGESERLFDTTVRTVRVLTAGAVDALNWVEGPDDLDLM